MYDLVKKSWKTVGSVPWVSTQSSVSLAWMGKNHLILFGSNTEQDGAIIVAYNIVLGVGSCRYPMKMYTEGARIYCYNDRIILEASNHIGMLPYVLETKRNLSSLLGSHEIIQEECTEFADWGMPIKPLPVCDEVQELLKLGLTERSICSQVIQPLFEKNDCQNIRNTLKYFKDVPESILVQLINYTLRLINFNKINVSSLQDFAKWYTDFSHLEKSKDKIELLNHVFEISFSDALLIPYLRESLTLNDALFLMTYITFLLIDTDSDIDVAYESKLCDWCILLMDAFYQQFLMTKDEKVTNVLDNSLATIASLVSHLNKIDNVLPLLNKIVSGKVLTDDSEDTLSYTIEMMQI